jgi:hypothetical protein
VIFKIRPSERQRAVTNRAQKYAGYGMSSLCSEPSFGYIPVTREDLPQHRNELVFPSGQMDRCLGGLRDFDILPGRIKNWQLFTGQIINAVNTAAPVFTGIHTYAGICKYPEVFMNTAGIHTGKSRRHSLASTNTAIHFEHCRISPICVR